MTGVRIRLALLVAHLGVWLTVLATRIADVEI